jgi:hypothetical protein
VAGKQKLERPLRPPAATPEARENQLVELAVNEAERQMREGVASAQVISHYLKLGSTREMLEQERLRSENELLKARVEALQQQGRLEELTANALKAFRSYSGQEDEGEYDDD